jgi:hypothetical protein
VRPVLGRCEGTAVDELDSVAVRIRNERDPRKIVPVARTVRRLLRLDADLGQVRERGVDVLHCDGEVVVAVTQVVGLLPADVDRQLEAVFVARQPMYTL